MPDERGSFRQIGDLTNKIADTLSTEDTTTSGSIEKALPASITTLPTVKHTSTITPSGGPGSALQSVSRRVTAVREAMALLDPDKTWDAIKVWLPLPVSSSLRRQTIDWYNDPDYGYTPIHARGFLPITASPAEIETGLAIVAEALRPVDNKTLIAELTTLKLLTVSRSNSDDEMELVLRAYARELGRYPRDIVLAVIHKRARTEKWWPALAELLGPIEELTADRVDLREALLQARGE